MRRELATCEDIATESSDDHRLLLQEATILAKDIQTCEASIRIADKENRAVRPLLEEMTASIAAKVHNAIATGRHCGHQNEKQKIRKMLQLELDNLRLRKDNLELQREARDQRCIFAPAKADRIPLRPNKWPILTLT